MQSQKKKPSVYKSYNLDEIMDMLHNLRKEKDVKEQSISDDIEIRRDMIKEIVAITKEKPSVYKGYNLDEIMDMLHNLREEKDDIEIRRDMIKEIVAITKEKPSVYKGYNLDEIMDMLHNLREEKDDSSEDRSEEDTDDSSEDRSEEDTDSSEDRPAEDTEILDNVQSTLANVIKGQKNIGEMTRVQESIIQCMGLLA